MKVLAKECRTLLLITVIAVLGLVVPNGYGDVPTMDEVKEMVKEVTDANRDAAANTPGTRTKKAHEDKLDQAEQKLDDAKRRAEKVNDNEKSTDRQKDAAKKAVKKAEATRDKQKETADSIKTKKPDKDAAYRKALERRRAARRKLQDARSVLQPAMRGLGRKIVEDRYRKINGGLKKASQYQKYTQISALGTGTLGDLVSSGAIAVGFVGMGETTGTVAELSISNLGEALQQVVVPAMILVSRSGSGQNYAAPFPQLVEVPPGQEVTVPIEGVCLNRSRPPIASGNGGDILAQDIYGTVLNPTIPILNDEKSTSKDKPKSLGEQLEIAKKKQEEADGAFKKFQEDYVNGNAALKKEIDKKKKDRDQSISNRERIGLDELEEIYQKKGIGGQVDRDLSIERQQKDVAKVKKEFMEFYLSTVADALAKGDRAKRKKYEKLQNEKHNATIRVEMLEAELKRRKKKGSSTEDALKEPLTAISIATDAVGQVSQGGLEEKKEKLKGEIEDLGVKIEKADAAATEAAKKYAEFINGVVDGNKGLKDKIDAKWKTVKDAIDNRKAIGSEERDEIEKEKGQTHGANAERQESWTREQGDIDELMSEFWEFYLFEAVDLVSKEGGPNHETFKDLENKKHSTTNEADGLKTDKENKEAELKQLEEATKELFSEDEVTGLFTAASAIFETVDLLQKEGAFEGMPYPSAEKQKEIVTQWVAWSSPVIAEVTGETPATKEDLTKVIEEQVEMTPEVKEKMKPGIDNIWATVELTGEKAKGITDEAAAADEAALEASINETI